MREEKSTHYSLVSTGLIVNEDDPSSFATDSNLVQSLDIAEKMEAVERSLERVDERGNLVAVVVIKIVKYQSSEERKG